MDYKYIEQLLERYWECETTPQEERILKAFLAKSRCQHSCSATKACSYMSKNKRSST